MNILNAVENNISAPYMQVNNALPTKASFITVLLIGATWY